MPRQEPPWDWLTSEILSPPPPSFWSGPLVRGWIWDLQTANVLSAVGSLVHSQTGHLAAAPNSCVTLDKSPPCLPPASVTALSHGPNSLATSFS